MRKTGCIYCGARATRWCDLVIGFDSAGGELASLDTPIYRCDAPLCVDHAVHKGNIFFSGAPGVAGVETIDHCCGHPEPERWEPISADEAERRRYRHRCLSSGPLRAISNPQRGLFTGIS